MGFWLTHNGDRGSSLVDFQILRSTAVMLSRSKWDHLMRNDSLSNPHHWHYWISSLYIWLVVWLPFGLFSHILGISSSQLTNSYFQRGSNHQPDINQPARTRPQALQRLDVSCHPHILAYIIHSNCITKVTIWSKYHTQMEVSWNKGLAPNHTF